MTLNWVNVKDNGNGNRALRFARASALFTLHSFHTWIKICVTSFIELWRRTQENPLVHGLLSKLCGWASICPIIITKYTSNNKTPFSWGSFRFMRNIFLVETPCVNPSSRQDFKFWNSENRGIPEIIFCTGWAKKGTQTKFCYVCVIWMIPKIPEIRKQSLNTTSREINFVHFFGPPNTARLVFMWIDSEYTVETKYLLVSIATKNDIMHVTETGCMRI